MGRLIDADALKNKLKELPGGYPQSFAGKACLMAIDDAPTFDYAPRQQWISVKDRLPEWVSNKVLVWVEGGFRPFMGRFREGDCIFPDEWFNLEAEGECFESPVTHWMELPEGPKEE